MINSNSFYKIFDFSIMIPTRNRKEALNNCINNIVSKAKRPENVEILIVCDFDDSSMYNFIKEVHENALWNKIDIKLIYRKRVPNIINAYYNDILAQYSHGRFLWIMNDECEIKNDEWDIILLENINNFLKDKQDKFLYVSVDDDTHSAGSIDETGCCFPIVSREAVMELGFFMPNEFTMWGADTALFQIFKDLPQNRILKLLYIKLEHKSFYHHKELKIEPDKTSYYVQDLSQNMEAEWNLFRTNRHLYVGHLANKTVG